MPTTQDVTEFINRLQKATAGAYEAKMGAFPIPTPPLPQPATVSHEPEAKFFVIWGHGTPTVRHATLTTVEAEANRLARANPGKKFFILSALESVTVPAIPIPPAVWRAAN